MRARDFLGTTPYPARLGGLGDEPSQVREVDRDDRHADQQRNAYESEVEIDGGDRDHDFHDRQERDHELAIRPNRSRSAVLPPSTTGV